MGNTEPFKQARAYVHTLGLRNVKEWRKYCKGKLPGHKRKLKDIPADPQGTYREQWTGYWDWLGTTNRRARWRPFEQAREFAQGLRLKTQAQWVGYCAAEPSDKTEKPDDIPKKPDQVYEREWVSWSDFLGTGRVGWGGPGFWSFEKARRYVRKLGLRSHTQWIAYCAGRLSGKGRRLPQIPSAPNEHYENEWISWGNFLGSGRMAPTKRRFLLFGEARAYARKLGLKSESEWRKYSLGKVPGKKRPDCIPSNPNRTYKNKGWVDWPDWLGTATSECTSTR